MMLRKTTLVFLLFLVLSSHMIVPPRVAVAGSIHKGGSNIKVKVVRKIDARGSTPRQDGHSKDR
ncbi:hypothetical protein BT93_L0238 [Corymbia citriodora subsp. variegata]|uniref:Transmembrane protein n=1 Tax=Corymbia citriodora subsp. variegata TaxID=360336 RepID=A0A8T0CQA5_CORYI|nr:hypothetical protein BT93_L0238 [Corymbia citriodora subsp. variegata]